MSRRRRARLITVAGVAAAVILVATSWVIGTGQGWPCARPREASSAVAGQPPSRVTEEPIARLAVAGDTVTGADAEYATAQAMAAQAGSDPYDGLLLLGDLVYEEGDATLVDQVITEPFAPVLGSGADLLPVLGKHDYR